ncbi:27073_t:CDS:2 [Gigaspora margarita]|uniref:27073_t:CDS:1 n=1 Tax=Gigaspora margarita TaxID=4874 RepID=A0ABN7VSS4_GIGMA|nr:27073_t:CDS:2 [Gigaspora margarita]
MFILRVAVIEMEEKMFGPALEEIKEATQSCKDYENSIQYQLTYQNMIHYSVLDKASSEHDGKYRI